MVKQTARPSMLRYVYTHNPFYAISAVLMLYAIWTAYRIRGIDPANCGLMIGALSAYTLLLAIIGVGIVRWGRVWEDARSILLLLLVLFLAVSISTDDLFVKAETSTQATFLLLSGFLFSAMVSEGALWGTGVRLGPRYRIPYHLMLGLFYVTPWFYSPEIHPRLGGTLNQLLFLFPVAASVLLLTLIPAIRGGARYVEPNATPWQWPWFPGTAFGVICGAFCLRSYTLTMTFGIGPVWREGFGSRSVEFDTIWGPYFLVPLFVAGLILLLEIGLVSGNRRLVLRTIRSAPLLLLLAIPWQNGQVFREFLQRVVSTAGSPLWISTWFLVAFFFWAWLRGVFEAAPRLLITMALLTIVDAQTVDLHSLSPPHAWPMFVIGAILLTRGVWLGSSWLCTTASALGALGLWYLLPQTSLVHFRTAICLNSAWWAFLIIGLCYRDAFARFLRVVAAMIFPVATFLVVAGSQASAVPLFWRTAYLVSLALACLSIAKVFRNLWYLYAFGGMLGVPAYAVVVQFFHRAADAIGRDAMTAFVWSLGTLMLATLISASKARWLPRKIWPSFRNGNGNSVVPQGERPTVN